MKSRIIRILILVVTFVILVACLASCSSDAEIPEGFQDATCDGEMFRLFIPTQWNVNTESGISGGIVSINDNISVNMVKGEAVREDETIADYWERTVSEYKLVMQSFKLLKDGVTTTMGGKAARAYQFTCNRGSTEFKYYQVIAVHKGNYYTFTYCAPTVKYDTYESEVDEMVDKLIFYNQPYEVGNTRVAVEDPDAPDGMVRVSDDRVAYKFFAPVSWKIDPNMGQSAVYFSEDDRSNVTAVGQMPETSSGVLILKDYIETLQKDYKEAFGNLEIVSRTADGELTVAGRAAVRTVMRVKTGGVVYLIDQTVIIKGEMVYLITYTATEDKFDLHKDDVQSMIDAFSFR